MSDYPDLIFSDGEDFNASRLNRATSVLDMRLRAIEALSISFNDAVDTLNRYGLQRLNEAVQPVYEKLVAIARIGVIFQAPSSTVNRIGLGPKTFVIPDDRRTTFAPAAYLQILSAADPGKGLYGSTQSYDVDTGMLVVVVDQVKGLDEGDIASWIISAAGTPDLITSAADLGVYTQAQADQKIDAAVAALRGAVPADRASLAAVNAALDALTAGAVNIRNFAQASTAIANRLQVDAAQGLSAAAKQQGRDNLGALGRYGDTLAGQLVALTNVDGSIAAQSSSGSTLQVQGTGGAAAMTFHRPGAYATWFGLDTDNQFKFGGWSAGQSSYTFWTAANFDPSTKANVSGASFTGNVGAPYFGSSGDIRAAGHVFAGQRLVVGEGAAASYIQMSDSDEGNRYIHCNSGSIGFLGSDNNWNFYVRDDGSVWSRQFGDLNTRIEVRASAFADDRFSRSVQSARWVFAGDLDNSWNANNGLLDPYAGGMISSRATAWNGSNYISTVYRWRYLQIYIPAAGGWITAGFAS